MGWCSTCIGSMTDLHLLKKIFCVTKNIRASCARLSLRFQLNMFSNRNCCTSAHRTFPTLPDALCLGPPYPLRRRRSCLTSAQQSRDPFSADCQEGSRTRGMFSVIKYYNSFVVQFSQCLAVYPHGTLRVCHQSHFRMPWTRCRGSMAYARPCLMEPRSRLKVTGVVTRRACRCWR